ncbi:hypothetical protein AB0N05_37835 [Nocardia sp. NPDC051030]|uniref:hypothetical protein n=1 Tax=Nocardia sp. NPDC051030 TaxID=3155162 RepID=UPI00343545EA
MAVRLGRLAEPLRGEGDSAVRAMWDLVAETPRWRRARVTPDNAESRLKDSRDGLRYNEAGQRSTTDWRDRWSLHRDARRMRAKGTSDSLEAAQVYEGVLADGYPPPEDWEASGSWYSSRGFSAE